jgi:hypothetical protein
MPPPAPEHALGALAEQLRAEDSVITPHVRDAEDAPVLGVLVAAGPRTARAPAEYALLVESVREGYLLHYGVPRVIVGAGITCTRAASRGSRRSETSELSGSCRT